MGCGERQRGSKLTLVDRVAHDGTGPSTFYARTGPRVWTSVVVDFSSARVWRTGLGNGFVDTQRKLCSATNRLNYRAERRSERPGARLRSCTSLGVTGALLTFWSHTRHPWRS